MSLPELQIFAGISQIGVLQSEHWC